MNKHPNSHAHHREVLSQRDKAERDIAAPADAGALDAAFLDIDRVEYATVPIAPMVNAMIDSQGNCRPAISTAAPASRKGRHRRGTALAKQVVAHEHGRELFDILQFQHRKHGHRKSDEPFGSPHRKGSFEDIQVERDGQRRADRKPRSPVCSWFRLVVATAEICAEFAVTADPSATDEGLRRGCNAVFRLERIGLFAGREPIVLNHETLMFEQPLGFRPIGTHVFITMW